MHVAVVLPVCLPEVVDGELVGVEDHPRRVGDHVGDDDEHQDQGHPGVVHRRGQATHSCWSVVARRGTYRCRLYFCPPHFFVHNRYTQIDL